MFGGITPQISNICGYVVGLMVSFILNRNWVFAAREASIKRQIAYFLLVFVIAFSVNFSVLNMLLMATVNAWLAQVLAGISYTLSFYALNKRLVFT